MSKKQIDYNFLELSCGELREFHKVVGKNVQKIRQSKGFSQLDLSLMIGNKSVSLIAGAEAGYRSVKFSLDHLYKIAKALEVDICEFFKTNAES